MLRSATTTTRTPLAAGLLVFVASCGRAPLPAEVARTLFRFPPRAVAQPDAEDVARGAVLFRETRLSADGRRSCATCHRVEDPDHVHGDGPPVPWPGTALPRDVPAIRDAARNAVLTSDGFAAEPAAVELEDYVAHCLEAPEKLGRTRWPVALPGAGTLGRRDAAAAISAWIATQVSDGRWDRFLDGDDRALTAGERDGLGVFVRSGCAACHGGRLLGGRSLQRFAFAGFDADDGRYAVTGDPDDRKVFEAPPLRLAAATPPYLHTGKIPTLAEAVRTMARVQAGIELADRDVEAVVAFLEAASDPRSRAPGR